MTREELNSVGAEILDSCIAVHRELGPGLLESVYVHALKIELEWRGIPCETKVKVPLFYKKQDTGKYYEIDLLVAGEIIVEAKAVEIIHPVCEAQLISYLRLADKRLGYLINFNVSTLLKGFQRFVNKF